MFNENVIRSESAGTILIYLNVSILREKYGQNIQNQLVTDIRVHAEYTYLTCTNVQLGPRSTYWSTGAPHFKRACTKAQQSVTV